MYIIYSGRWCPGLIRDYVTQEDFNLNVHSKQTEVWHGDPNICVAKNQAKDLGTQNKHNCAPKQTKAWHGDSKYALKTSNRVAS